MERHGVVAAEKLRENFPKTRLHAYDTLNKQLPKYATPPTSA
jgi:hypothetical protein